jgi:Tfp pilus assembly protein PilF
MVKTGVLFFLAAIALIALGALFLRNTTSLARIGGTQFERRRRRRMIGRVLLVAAGILVVVGATTLYYSTDNVDDSTSAVITSSIAQSPTKPAAKPSPASISESPSQPVAILPATPAVSSPQPENATAPLSPIVIQAATPLGARRLAQASRLFAQKDFNGALDQVNAAIAADSKLAAAYSLRATIYVQGKLWDKAEKDYGTALQLDPKNVEVKYNLAQVSFIQNKFDVAREGFAALEQDPLMGDVSSYKVFLCDLLGGHEATAAKELDAFNQVGSNASYYFANMAWSLYHKKTDEAADWEASAQRIYPPEKFNLYAESLIGLRRSLNAGANPSPGP